MYVPNFVPEPLEVTGNITQSPYPERLRFIRKVSLLHLGSVAVVAAVAAIPLPKVPILWVGEIILGLLAVLCFVRIGWRGKSSEAVASTFFLPALLPLIGLAARELSMDQVQVWSAGIGAATAVIYALLCGRDFSFVGQFLLAFIASSFVISIVATAAGLPASEAAEALLWNLAYLSFYVYDLASLMARRRKGEELGAVVDLYRDVLNIFGFVKRCLRHWKRHKIWTVPWGDFLPTLPAENPRES